jgi:hypothetical protein
MHMADLPPYSTPRWVKIIGIIVLVLILLVGILRLTGVGGNHGPSRHLPSGGAGDTPPSSVVEAYTPFDGGTGGATQRVANSVRHL